MISFSFKSTCATLFPRGVHQNRVHRALRNTRGRFSCVIRPAGIVVQEKGSVDIFGKRLQPSIYIIILRGGVVNRFCVTGAIAIVGIGGRDAVLGGRGQLIKVIVGVAERQDPQQSYPKKRPALPRSSRPCRSRWGAETPSAAPRRPAFPRRR